MSDDEDDDIGTVRWFGESWHAPINDPRTQVLTPIGKDCIDCSQPINGGDRGVLLNEGSVAFHFSCFMRSLGLEVDEHQRVIGGPERGLRS